MKWQVGTMKILLLACLSKSKSGNIFGGAEKSIINLANWLSQGEHDVLLASVEGAEKAYPIDEKVHFVGFEINSDSKIMTHLKMLINTQRVINEYKPDVIISFWIHPLFYTVINPRSRKIKLIYSERNDPNLEYGKVSKIMRDIVLKHTSAIVFQTSDAQKYFSEEIQRKSSIIHNPVYIKNDDFQIKKGFDNRIVSVGRLNPQKNYELLIEAFYDISNKYPDLILEIYGEGPLRESLQKKINDYGMNNRIRLMGAYSDVLKRIHGARLFVLSSNYEGMPNALMEAMCLGIPVISSDCPCGGPRELIQEGVNGFLFLNNDKNDLIKKMEQVLKLGDKELVNLANEERNIIETHNNDMIFGKWLKVIEGANADEYN